MILDILSSRWEFLLELSRRWLAGSNADAYLSRVTFRAKLHRRVSELKLNKAAAAESVGLPKTTISSYLAKATSIPRGDIALKIAKAISVPVEWLLDDAADWPPPKSHQLPATQLTDDELMREVCRRFRLLAISYYGALTMALATDWSQVASQLLKLPLTEQAKGLLADDARLALSLRGFTQWLHRYDPSIQSFLFHDELPGSDMNPSNLTLDHLMHMEAELKRKFPSFVDVGDREAMSEVLRNKAPKEAAKAEEWRKNALAKIAKTKRGDKA